jgi:hypothetical protein
VLYHDPLLETVHRSENEGKDWKPVEGVPEGEASELIQHPHDNQVVSRPSVLIGEASDGGKRNTSIARLPACFRRTSSLSKLSKQGYHTMLRLLYVAFSFSGLHPDSIKNALRHLQPRIDLADLHRSCCSHSFRPSHVFPLDREGYVTDPIVVEADKTITADHPSDFVQPRHHHDFVSLGLGWVLYQGTVCEDTGTGKWGSGKSCWDEVSSSSPSLSYGENRAAHTLSPSFLSFFLFPLSFFYSSRLTTQTPPFATLLPNSSSPKPPPASSPTPPKPSCHPTPPRPPPRSSASLSILPHPLLPAIL